MLVAHGVTSGTAPTYTCGERTTCTRTVAPPREACTRNGTSWRGSHESPQTAAADSDKPPTSASTCTVAPPVPLPLWASAYIHPNARWPERKTALRTHRQHRVPRVLRRRASRRNAAKPSPSRTPGETTFRCASVRSRRLERRRPRVPPPSPFVPQRLPSASGACASGLRKAKLDPHCASAKTGRGNRFHRTIPCWSVCTVSNLPPTTNCTRMRAIARPVPRSVPYSNSSPGVSLEIRPTRVRLIHTCSPTSPRRASTTKNPSRDPELNVDCSWIGTGSRRAAKTENEATGRRPRVTIARGRAFEPAVNDLCRIGCDTP